jgi:hypothetical protein
MRFNAFSRHFNMELRSNHAIIDALDRRALANDVQIYRGALTGSPDSWARIVMAAGQPRGMFFDGSELYAIELSDQGEAVVFRLADLTLEPGTISCSSTSNATTGADLFKLVATEGSTTGAQGPGAFSELNMAVIADYEFTSDKGGSTQAELITRMNNVDGIFSAQLGVQLNVNRIDAFSAPDDPFTDESESGALLDEVAAYRRDNAQQNSNGLTHLFTGRDLDGSTVGVAFSSALCLTRFGAGLTQGTHSVTVDSLIAAHEIGHNFGAPHDGTSGSPCEAETGDFLMSPSINGSDIFSSCSITQMQDDVARASCINPLPTSDIAVVAGAQPGAWLLGNSESVSFEVNSTGTGTATNVSVAITIPSIVALDDVSTTSGSCSSGAGTVDCSIGSLSGGSGATVTLSLTANGMGSGSIMATGSADTDENSNNNQATLAATVDPAVDLALTVPGSTRVNVDQSATVRPQVANRSSLTASNVTITITPSAGLQIDSVSWPAGSCAIANGAADCSAASLAANSSSTISVQVTGTVEGAQSYAMTASADEVDRDASNNDVSGQVSVGTVTSPPGDDDSGGGSFGLMGLLFLLLVESLRCRSGAHAVRKSDFTSNREM